MFKSIVYVAKKDEIVNMRTVKLSYQLIDNNFISNITMDFMKLGFDVPCRMIESVGYVVWKVYAKRQLDIGKELYNSFRWFCESCYTKRSSNLHPLEKQDAYCSRVIPNWKEYSTRRDDLIQKMGIME